MGAVSVLSLRLRLLIATNAARFFTERVDLELGNLCNHTVLAFRSLIRMLKPSNIAVVLELDCGDTLFTESSGNISLPGNPTGYLATVNCTYTISTNRTDVIWLNAYFQTTMKFLQSFQDCEGESVMVGYLHSSQVL